MTVMIGLHPWLTSPEALKAVEGAVQIPLAMLPAASRRVGTKALQRQALMILTECALPPRDQLESVLSRAVGGAHVGSMYAWPEAERAKYATREVGYALLTWVRGHSAN